MNNNYVKIAVVGVVTIILMALTVWMSGSVSPTVLEGASFDGLIQLVREFKELILTGGTIGGVFWLVGTGKISLPVADQNIGLTIENFQHTEAFEKMETGFVDLPTDAKNVLKSAKLALDGINSFVGSAGLSALILALEDIEDGPDL